MHRGHLTLIFALVACVALAQESDSDPNPGDASTGARDAGSDRTPVHPDGDTPHERMLELAHTDALPRFDRVELYAVSMPAPFDDEKPKRKATSKTFPVRPYGLHADIHAHITLQGDACDDLGTAWRSLTFDRFGGALCHYPAYGLRMFRGDDLLFETTVCWKCQNFYVPRYDAEERRFTHGWYGFADDDNSKALLKLLQSHLPHPKL